MRSIFVGPLALVLALVVASTAHAQATGDPVMGEKQFGQCRVCHSTIAKGPNGVGPNLFGIAGSKAARPSIKFAYSDALKASKLVWDDATLDRWIADPATTVKGTNMHFMGIPRKPARQNIIAYLKTLK